MQIVRKMSFGILICAVYFININQAASLPMQIPGSSIKSQLSHSIDTISSSKLYLQFLLYSFYIAVALRFIFR